MRELALLVATGATPLDLARVVLGPAILTGAIGATLGAAGGSALLPALLPGRTAGQVAAAAGGVVLAGALGLLLAVGTATWPAVVAARATPVTALRGAAAPAAGGGGAPPATGGDGPDVDRVRAPSPASTWAGVLVGSALVAVGYVLARSQPAADDACRGCLPGADVLAQRAATLSGGILLAVVGLVILLRATLGALARVRAGTVVTSYVLRDASRHRARFLPAVAASTLLVGAAGAGAIYQSTTHADEVARHMLAAPVGSMLVAYEQAPDVDAATEVQALRVRSSGRPAVRDVIAVQALTAPASATTGTVTARIADHPLDGSRFSALVQLGPLVATDGLLSALGSDVTVSDLTAGDLSTDDLSTGALSTGARVLVTDPAVVRPDGTVTLVVSNGTENVELLAAAVVDEELRPYADVFVPQELAEPLGLTASTVGALVLGDPELSDADEATLLPLLDPGTGFVERGPHVFQDSGTTAALVGAGAVGVLAVIGVMTALAAQEARGDLGVLEALGAAPRTRRRIVSAQAALVVVPAGVVGVPVGLALAGIFLRAQPALDGVAPTLPTAALVGLLLVLPGVVVLGAWLTAGSRTGQRRV